MKLDEFNTLVASKPVSIVKMGATWCMPCKSLDATLDRIQANHPEVNIMKIDVEDEPEIATHFGITSVPVMLFYKNGEGKDMTVGNIAEANILSKIDELNK